MKETDEEIFERVCKTGIMTVPNPAYEGMTPEEVLEAARVKDLKAVLNEKGDYIMKRLSRKDNLNDMRW